MSTVKEEISRMLEALPDDVSMEDIQYHLYVRQKVARGLSDMREGRLVSREAAEERLGRWTAE